MAFINYMLDPEIHAWVAENILYKVPNKAAMEAVDPRAHEAISRTSPCTPDRARREREPRRPRRGLAEVHRADDRGHGQPVTVARP